MVEYALGCQRTLYKIILSSTADYTVYTVAIAVFFLVKIHGEKTDEMTK